MKSISKVMQILILPAVMFGATSCLQDEPMIDWSVVEPLIEIADNDHAQFANNMQQGDIAEFMIIVNYTASYASDVTEPIEVQLKVDLDTIQAINSELAASEEPFEPFPAGSYDDLRLKSTIEAGTKRDTIHLSVPLNEDFKVGRSYILPIKIAGASDGYTISGNFDHLELEINMAEPEVGLSVSGAVGDKNPNIKNDVKVGDAVSFDVKLAIDYPETVTEELVAGLFVDLSRIAMLNASSAAENPYVVLSSATVADYFTTSIAVKPYDPEGGDEESEEDFQSTQVTVASGEMEAILKVDVNTSNMKPGERYVLPIEIENVSKYFTIGSGVIYLEVNMADAAN